MPAAEPASRPTRRGGAARPSIGARGAVRVGADFTSEFPAADPTSTEGYASLVRAGEAVLSLLDATIQEALHVKHPVFTALAVLDGSPEPLPLTRCTRSGRWAADRRGRSGCGYSL